MRILVAHNAYQHRGGEDVVVESEVELLRSRGHTVEMYQVHNDALNTMAAARAAATTVWSLRTPGELRQICERFKPELIHVHNTFPLISPSLYWAASRLDVPVVQTLHNFRLLCPQAIFLRESRICEDCLGKVPWRAVTRKCYRQSAAQTAVLAGMLTVHRALGTYKHQVTRYIALNEFALSKYVEGGLPRHLFRIKPNFVASAVQPEWKTRSGGMYVGRLSSEKGLEVLAEAFRLRPEVDLQVIGSGPLEKLASETFGERWLGFRPLEEIMRRMETARYLVLPSICYENSPRTIVEAYASGLPVIASRLGSLADIVKDGVTGLLFRPGDAGDLAEKLAWAEAHPEEMMRMGRAARAEYEAKYTPERNYELLMEIYEDAISTLRRKRDTASRPACA